MEVTCHVTQTLSSGPKTDFLHLDDLIVTNIFLTNSTVILWLRDDFFKSILTTFEASFIFEAARAVAKIVSSLNSNHHK